MKSKSTAVQAKRPAAAEAPSAPKRARRDSKLVAMIAAPFRLVRRVFFSELPLARGSKKRPTPAKGKPGVAANSQQPAVPGSAELELMRTELRKLLDLHPMTRHVVRHLVYVERALKLQGEETMTQVPVEILRAALEQLESLVTNWSNHGLAALRSKMSVAVIGRSKDPFYGANGTQASTFNSDSRLQVGDVSHSMFLEIERQYQGLVSPEVLNSLKSEFASSFQATQPLDRTAELAATAR
ncbi:MAG TPA: hypothetical protein VJO99_15215 [Burkholderiaceae bacterium]|nr:hypothetical protein [Burkholderiaceae bacterium]